MIKSSVSYSYGDEKVHYEQSHGSYVTEYDKVALTNYLVHIPNQNYVIVHIDVGGELNKRVNGGYRMVMVTMQENLMIQ